MTDVYQATEGSIAFMIADQKFLISKPVLAQPIFRTFTLIWGNFADFRSVRP